MSRLGDIEDAFVSRLTAAVFNGSPLFRTVRGVSGGYRRAIREALLRETMPAAHVAFTDEPTAPETAVGRRGARFAVLVAERRLRQGSDPRRDDAAAPGAFTLLDQTRQELDGVVIVTGFLAMVLHEKFIDSDDRVAVYELLYRVQAIVAAAQAPGVPETLQAFVGPTGGDVTLSWSAAPPLPAEGEPQFYNVYRRLPTDSGFVLQEAVSKDALSALLSGQPTGKTIQYHMTAENAGGESGASNVVVVVP